jgi:hypothetical protein
MVLVLPDLVAGLLTKDLADMIGDLTPSAITS